MQQSIEGTKCSRYVLFFGALSIWTLMVSNFIGAKVTTLGTMPWWGPIECSVALIVFPIVYITNDLVTEVYGYATTRKIIWASIFLLIITCPIMLLADSAPASKDYADQAAFSTIFGFVPRVMIASVVALAVGEFCNSMILSRMKVNTVRLHHTTHKDLWKRLLGSSLMGHGLDTVLFTLIAFYGVLPDEVVIGIMITEYLIKITYETVTMPATYRVVSWLKRKESIDAFDLGVSLNPFSLRTA